MPLLRLFGDREIVFARQPGQRLDEINSPNPCSQDYRTGLRRRVHDVDRVRPLSSRAVDVEPDGCDPWSDEFYRFLQTPPPTDCWHVGRFRPHISHGRDAVRHEQGKPPFIRRPVRDVVEHVDMHVDQAGNQKLSAPVDRVSQSRMGGCGLSNGRNVTTRRCDRHVRLRGGARTVDHGDMRDRVSRRTLTFGRKRQDGGECPAHQRGRDPVC
jgi:hypothetical protein